MLYGQDVVTPFRDPVFARGVADMIWHAGYTRFRALSALSSAMEEGG